MIAPAPNVGDCMILPIRGHVVVTRVTVDPQNGEWVADAATEDGGVVHFREAAFLAIEQLCPRPVHVGERCDLRTAALERQERLDALAARDRFVWKGADIVVLPGKPKKPIKRKP